MTKDPFLELGASAVPHPRATHAIDRDSKKRTLNFANTLYKDEGETTKEKFERRIKQMDYKFGFNYNTQKFPWPNNSFKIVYSHASLSHYGNPSHAFKEAYRVLKHGGKLIFDASGTKRQLINLKKKLIDIEFSNISIRIGEEYTHEGKTEYDTKVSAIKG